MSMWHYCATLLKSTLLNKVGRCCSEILAKWSQGYMPWLLLKNHVPICTINVCPIWLEKCYAQKCLYQCGRPQNYMGEITVGTQPLKLHVWKVKRCHTPTLTSLQRETDKPSHSCMYLKGKFHTTLTFLQNARMLRLVCGTFNELHWRCHTHNLNILAVFCLFLSQIDRFT